MKNGFPKEIMPLAFRLKTLTGESILGKVIICAPREEEVQFMCCAKSLQLHLTLCDPYGL